MILKWTLVLTAGCVLLSSEIAGAQTCDSSALPSVTLTPGEYYFRVDNQPTLLLGTNPYGPTSAEFSPLFAGAAANERVVRLIVDSIAQHPAAAGEVDEAWAAQLDSVLCDAQANGLYVLVVLDVWPNWNDVAVPARWASSIYNAANGGPANSPSDVLQAGATQDAWLDWIEAATTRLAGHSNILGWEIFSEFNNIYGAATLIGATQVPVACAATNTNLPAAVCLMEAAAARIRGVDTRPITASVAGVNDWVSLSTSSMDFLELHPYTDAAPIVGGNLDQAILDQVRARRSTYSKPVFIGESGLDQVFPDASALTLNPRGWVGINQAIWAGAVSGAMNARMLWYEDGYDTDGVGRVDLCTLGLSQYAAESVCTDGDATTTLTLHEVYQNASSPVKTFLSNVDYANFEPVTLTAGANLIGAALGSDTSVIGWVRDVRSAHDDTAADPYWPWRLMSGETVTVDLSGESADWIVDFYDTSTGTIVSSIDADQDAAGAITFTLPDFQGSIAFQIRAVAPLDVTINITPARRNNVINPNHRKPFVVAIRGTADFNTSEIMISSIRFGPGGAAPVTSTFDDPDGDGNMDLFLLFRPTDTGLTCGEVGATLTGELIGGRSFVGSDSVIIVGGCGP